MTPYHQAMRLCAIRYKDMEHFAARGDTEKLAKFIGDFEEGCCDQFPIPKLCRWLGYIQGVLIEKGMTSVEDERDWTRPLFRPLDFPDSTANAA